jgi:hypothetical protein
MIENCVLNVPKIIGHIIIARVTRYTIENYVKLAYMGKKIKCVYHSGLAKGIAKKHSVKIVDSRPKK